MSLERTTSEFTDEDPPPIELPPPEVTSTVVPEGTFSNRKGFVILAKKCAKMGYETELTYARGYVPSKNIPALRHHLLLRIRGEVDGRWGTVAGASWEAPALPGDDYLEAAYKTHGALIYNLPGKFGNKQLEEWLLDPSTDPRDHQEVT